MRQGVIIIVLKLVKKLFLKTSNKTENKKYYKFDANRLQLNKKEIFYISH